MLPFSEEAYFRLIANYTAAIWPAPLIACALAALCLAAVFRPRVWSDRAVAAVLAGFWLWTGLVWHLQHYATLVWAAAWFGALFALQGALLAWIGVARGRLGLRFRADAVGWAGLVLVLAGLAGHPLAAALAGPGWPSVPLVGVAPGPTVLFTLGLLLLSERPLPPVLLVVPTLWAAVQGVTAWLMDYPADLVVPAAALVALGLVPAQRLAAAR